MSSTLVNVDTKEGLSFSFTCNKVIESREQNTNAGIIIKSKSLTNVSWSVVPSNKKYGY